MAAFELSCLLVIFIIFVNAPAAPVLETLGPQVNPTLAVSSTDCAGILAEHEPEPEQETVVGDVVDHYH